MNVVVPFRPSPTQSLVISEDVASLKTVLEPQCPAALWNRTMPEAVLDWLDHLDPDLLPSGRVILQPLAVGDVIDQLCDISGLPEGPERSWLRADVMFLSDYFASLTKTRYLRLRLDVVQHNACRKFHVDAITARLICTYRGTGTQYGCGVAGGDPDEVFTVPTGAPIVLRGTLWPEEPATGLLHRSPPIEGTGETRLMLVLDPIDDPDEAI